MHECRFLIVWTLSLLLICLSLSKWVAWSVAWKNQNFCHAHPVECQITPVTTWLAPTWEQARSPQFEPQVAQALLEVIVQLHQPQPVLPPSLRLLLELQAHDLKIGFLTQSVADPRVLFLTFQAGESEDSFYLDLLSTSGVSSPFQWLTEWWPVTRNVLYPWRWWKRHRARPVGCHELLQGQPSSSLPPPPMRVYGQIYRLYLKIRPQLLAFAGPGSSSGPFHLVVNGFSLGGCLATLAALDLCLNRNWFQSASLYTFGAPRVGNQYLAVALEQAPQLTSCYRIQNSADVLPNLPWAVLPNNQDPHEPHYYLHAGREVAYTLNWSSGELNHCLANYVRGVQSFVSAPTVNGLDL